jgi:hypothetical protein
VVVALATETGIHVCKFNEVLAVVHHSSHLQTHHRITAYRTSFDETTFYRITPHGIISSKYDSMYKIAGSGAPSVFAGPNLRFITQNGRVQQHAGSAATTRVDFVSLDDSDASKPRLWLPLIHRM